MSIILDALKKARKDRKKETELNDEAVFRQEYYEKKKGEKNKTEKSSRYFLFGLFGCLSVLVIFTGVFAGFIFIHFYGNDSNAGEKRGGVSFRTEREVETPSYKEEKDFQDKPTSTPEPEPTKIVVQIAAPPASTPESSPTPAPALTDTPRPNPTPRETQATPEPTLTPTPTKSPLPPERAQPSDLGLEIQGIMWDKYNPSVMINDRILEKGDRIDDMLIEKIERNHVLIRKHDIVYRFRY